MGGAKSFFVYVSDCVSERAISIILPSKKSCHTAEVLRIIDRQFGFEVKNIQTDNGSELMNKFAEMMDELGKTHFYNYLKKPMWNGKVERLNRTMQEEWLANPDIQYC